ncbi:MAG: hypothetical protein JWM26_3681 [Betaproteobacteria bacterium]|nr:hypothetical protein [Betaproteobacteria bacterium]
MNKLIAVALMSLFAVASVCAAELSNDDRSELRQRADELQAQRARNPEYQPGEGRLNPPAAAAPKARAHARRGAARKTAAKSAAPETRRAKAAKKARSLKNLPGAFVRK